MFKLIRLTVSFQAFGYILQFGAFFLFAKMLGAENQGILTIFRASGQIIASVLLFGLPAGIVYFVGRDRNSFMPVLKNCLKLFLVVFPLLVLCLFILPVNKLTRIFSVEKYVFYLLAFVFFLSLSNLYQLSVLSLKKYLYYNLFSFGSGFVIFALSVSIHLAPGTYSKLHFAMLAYILTYGLLFIYGTLLMINETRKITDMKAGRQSLGEQFKVGLRGFISGIAALLLFRLDLFLVGYFLSLKEVGIYSIALFGAEMVTRIPEWSASILKPMVASNEGGHVRRTLYLFYSAVFIALLLGVFFLFSIMAFPSFISNLAGKDFTGVETCLLLLLPRVVMQSGVEILAANLAGKGYPWYHPAGCTLPIFFLMIFDIILIPRFGVNGAALGNSLAYVSAAVVFWIGFRKCNEVAEDACLKTYWCTMKGYMHGHPFGDNSRI